MGIIPIAAAVILAAYPTAFISFILAFISAPSSPLSAPSPPYLASAGFKRQHQSCDMAV